MEAGGRLDGGLNEGELSTEVEGFKSRAGSGHLQLWVWSGVWYPSRALLVSTKHVISAKQEVPIGPASKRDKRQTKTRQRRGLAQEPACHLFTPGRS